VIFMEQKCGRTWSRNERSWRRPAAGFRRGTRGRSRVEAQVELVFPAEFEAGLAQRVVAYCAPGWPLARSAAWAAILSGDDAVFHVFLVRQAEVFLGRDVAQQRAAVPANHRRTNAAGEMIRQPGAMSVVSGPSV